MGIWLRFYIRFISTWPQKKPHSLDCLRSSFGAWLLHWSSMSVRILVQSVAAHLILIGHLPRPYFLPLPLWALVMLHGMSGFCMAMSRCWQALRISFLYFQLFSRQLYSVRHWRFLFGMVPLWCVLGRSYVGFRLEWNHQLSLSV